MNPMTGSSKRATEVERLAGLGRASQATHRLGSPELTYDTPTIRRKLFGKFPPIPDGSPSPWDSRCHQLPIFQSNR